MKTFFVACAAAFILFAAMAMASEAMARDLSLEKLRLGEKLFYDPTAGGSTNELSCNSCHKGGRRLENVASGAGLMRTIRRCLVSHLGGMVGEPKNGRDFHIVALRAYVLSLSREAPVSSWSSPSPQDVDPRGRPGSTDLNEP